ncbi:hypothetical protein SLEP1_g47531 [Rubroshorea leprosula]|uniref:Uncharacterized protein n=1 Tax=Rubroshorea leprosula TaxID=152421 RepID=A0AAV5LQT7_9ROSI|nr:hypothetical protein SLEP1_g47531 [Rubroshorea leprosula]
MNPARGFLAMNPARGFLAMNPARGFLAMNPARGFATNPGAWIRDEPRSVDSRRTQERGFATNPGAWFIPKIPKDSHPAEQRTDKGEETKQI